MNDDIFFEELRQDTATAFEKAPVKQHQLALKRVWNYSICATPIRRKSGVIFGLNWGGGGDMDKNASGEFYPYPPQTDMPDGSDILTYRFIRRTLPFLKTYLNIDDLSGFNYSNLCFFRTPAIADLKDEDWELSLPLFEKYVHYIDPPWLLMLGTTGVGMLKGLDLLSNLTENVAGQNGRSSYSYSGQLFNRPFIAVPHPQAQVRTSVRKELWNKACTQLVMT